MTLDADVAVRRGSFELSASLNAAAGDIVAVLGENGVGKSTLLHALAGIVPLTAGRVVVDGVDLTSVPVHRRRIGLVFQESLLFPHLSVLDNVAFGPRNSGSSTSDARRLAGEWLARVGLTELASLRPRDLSGGQAQRAALARALAADPRLLLLDEPLSALDAVTRVEIREELRERLADFDGVTVVVTHDALEALVLADSAVVLGGGRVVQSGPVGEVLARPRTDFVAGLAGVNLLRGRGDGQVVHLPSGIAVAGVRPVSGPAVAVVHPTAVAVYRDRPQGSPRNVWPVTLARVESRGSVVRLHAAGEPPFAADVTPAAATELDLRPGAQVWFAAKATEVEVYPA